MKYLTLTLPLLLVLLFSQVTDTQSQIIASVPPPEPLLNAEYICSLEQLHAERGSERDDHAPLGRQPVHVAEGQYTFSYLNSLSYSDLVNLLVTLQWTDLPELFTFNSDTDAFYSNSNRMLYLFDAVRQRGNNYTVQNDRGIPTLIEVIRSGFYLAFYYPDDLGYLWDETYKQNTWPAMRSVINNPNFGLGTTTQDDMVQALGLFIGIGSVPVDVVQTATNTFADFNANAATYMLDFDKRGSLYSLGNGIDYALVGVYLYDHPDPTTAPYYDQIDAYLLELGDLALFGTLHEDYTWLINNAVYWLGREGVYDSSSTPLWLLTQIIDTYGEWEYPSVEAAYWIVNNYGGFDADGDPIDWDQILDELEQQLLPNTATYDLGAVVFRYGTALTEAQVQKLYWASKEVKTQFHRITGSDTVLEPGNADDVLTMVIFNSPEEYQFNRFLNNMPTNNGGIYIEGIGTFFTYERTPAQSIYTLEELFRHEFTHYLQGRFLEHGLWGQGDIYDDERMTWFDEGQAEFMAGSTRHDGVHTRQAMASIIDPDQADRMTLWEVFNATYSGGFEFYRYGYGFWEYIYQNRTDIIIDMVGHVHNDDGSALDNYLWTIASNPSIESAYQNYLQYLADNWDSFGDPETSDDYIATIPHRDLGLISAEITTIAPLANMQASENLSDDIHTFTITGTYTGGSTQGDVADWGSMDTLADNWLDQIDDMVWAGYQTVNVYFTDYRVTQDNRWEYDITFFGNRGELDPNATPTPSPTITPTPSPTPTPLPLLGTYADDFNPAGYDGNDGSLLWSGDWVEINDNNSSQSGDIFIRTDSVDWECGNDGVCVVIFTNEGNEGIERTADLSMAGHAELFFDFVAFNTSLVLILDDGTQSPTVMPVTGNWGEVNSVAVTIEDFVDLTDQVTVRFLAQGGNNGYNIGIDNVRIDITAPTAITLSDSGSTTMMGWVWIGVIVVLLLVTSLLGFIWRFAEIDLDY